MPSPGADNMYFFNVTNPNEIIAGEKPRLEQVGPFRYRQYVKNVNCTWSEDENVLTYAACGLRAFQHSDAHALQLQILSLAVVFLFE